MMDRIVYIGMDPGLNGGVATLDENGKFLSVADMPVSNKTVTFKGVVDIIQDIMTKNNATSAVVSVEHQFFMPDDGKDRVWKTAMGYKTILDALSALILIGKLNITVKIIEAKSWKTKFNVMACMGSKETKRAKKERTHQRVLEIFGDDVKTSIYGPKHGLLDGRTDALLIALSALD